MQIGMVGLGRMGANIVRRLNKAGSFSAVVYDANAAAVGSIVAEGATGAGSLADFVQRLATPRTVWVMLPAGKVTEETINELAGLLQRDDVIIDGGNTFWQDDIRRAKALRAKGIHYLDVGTSGGVWGLERGYCLMIGGEKDGGGPSRSAVCGAGAGARRHPAHATAAKAAIPASSKATSMPGRTAPATSSR